MEIVQIRVPTITPIKNQPSKRSAYTHPESQPEANECKQLKNVALQIHIKTKIAVERIENYYVFKMREKKYRIFRSPFSSVQLHLRHAVHLVIW